MVLASWVHREQQKTIEFYQAELESVMKAQGKKRLLLTDKSQYVELADYNNEMPAVFNPAWNRQQQNHQLQADWLALPSRLQMETTGS